jgi:hypothetical protein
VSAGQIRCVNGIRQGWLPCAAILVALAIVGCQKAPTSPPGGPAGIPANTAPKLPKGPAITADPNPVPAGPDGKGTTVITWNTGDGKPGDVWVSINGAPEKQFAANRSSGQQDAIWIGKGEYDFRLYAGKEHKTVLASVKVARAAK